MVTLPGKHVTGNYTNRDLSTQMLFQITVNGAASLLWNENLPIR